MEWTHVPNQSVWPALHALARDRRTEDILEERLPACLVFGASARGGVQAEAVVPDRELGFDHDGRTPPHGELDRTAPQLGASRGEPRYRGRGEYVLDLVF